MQYNNHPKQQDIVTLANIHAGTDKKNVQFPLNDKAIFGNKILRKIWGLIFAVYGGDQFDDKNYTNVPRLTADVLAGDQEFSIPEEAMTIKSVSVKDRNDNYKELIRLNLDEIRDYRAEQEFLNTPGVPQYFSEIGGGQYKVYPAFDYSIKEGIDIEFDRSIVEIDPDADVINPGIDPHFHDAIGVGIAYEWAKINNRKRAEMLATDWIGYERSITSFYKEKFKRGQKRTVIKHNTESVNDFI